MMTDIELYKELISFCEQHHEEIESKFQRAHQFDSINEECYKKMFLAQRKTSAPIAPKFLKEEIPGLTELYRERSAYYMNPRNKYRKGLDIQLGQWYEKALQMFFKSKGIEVTKKGFPYPDYEVSVNGKVVAYYELKFIEAPFVSASSKIKDTYPYASPRYDYEASLTLDTGNKLIRQREKIESELLPEGVHVHYIWWFDCFHIKGVFTMPATEVFDYYDHLNGDVHTRKEREGDKEAHQETGKIYPPLLNMGTLSEYIQLFK
ncbi:MAG TPA: hypothetical protein PLV00_06190 [Caldisericia bacterium]|jgi:hypothetical protein|nr:hypothetical protein [Caldisericia bacterium]